MPSGCCAAPRASSPQSSRRTRWPVPCGLATRGQGRSAEAIILVNLCGRGDKDMETAAEWFDLLDEDTRGWIGSEESSCERSATEPASRRPPSTAPGPTGRAALIGYLPAGFPDVADHHRRRRRAGGERRRHHRDRHAVLRPGDGRLGHPGRHRAGPAGRIPGRARCSRSSPASPRRCDAAVLVMTYWNPVMRMGVDEFARRLAEAGGAGLITPGPDPGRGRRMVRGLGQVRTGPRVPGGPLVLAGARMAQTVKASRGFVYRVSIMGVTGARERWSPAPPSAWSHGRPRGRRRAAPAWGWASPARSTCGRSAPTPTAPSWAPRWWPHSRDGGVEAVAAWRPLSEGQPGLK